VLPDEAATARPFDVDVVLELEVDVGPDELHATIE
jgi:hypothetical protein